MNKDIQNTIIDLIKINPNSLTAIERMVSILKYSTKFNFAFKDLELEVVKNLGTDYIEFWSAKGDNWDLLEVEFSDVLEISEMFETNKLQDIINFL